MHLVTVKKFDICLLTGWSSTVFILLVNIFNHTFNLFINNIVKKPIIDESLFYVFFYLFIKYCFGGGDPFGTGYQVINNFFLYLKGYSLLKLRVLELLLVVKLLLLLVSMKTSKKEILLFLFSS